MEPAAFAEVAEPYIRQAVKNSAIDAAGIAALLQARCEKLTDIPEKVDFFDALPDYDVEFFTNKKSKTNAEVSKAMLEAAIPALEAISDWTVDAIHDTLIDLAAKLEVKNATLMWPVRIAAAVFADPVSVLPLRSATSSGRMRPCAVCVWDWTS